MIRLESISKHFGPLVALDRVSLDIVPGQILGLLGENGAGKSTLMHILVGILKPDSGTIISGTGVPPVSIGMVYQHFKLVPTLTGLQNLRLFLNKPPRVLLKSANDLLIRLRWTVPLDIAIEQLSTGQQQRIEILKALLAIEPPSATGNRQSAIPPTLVFDEPTAVLTPQETAELFAAMRTLREAGTAIVFISHKLAEVRQICDRIAILRRGKLVHEGPLKDIEPDAIAEKMVGARIEVPNLTTLESKIKNQKLKIKNAPPAPALSVEGLSTSLLKSISLQIAPGEILAIAGVDGNGQSHLVQTLLATRRPASGRIFIDGRDARAMATRDRLNHLAFIAEDRQREALILPLSVEENLMLKDYRSPRFNTLGWLRFRAWRRHAKTLVRQFDIRPPAPAATAGRLSGGNQQKLVLARELHAFGADDPHMPRKSLIVAVNPTRGLDIAATAFVFQKLLDARARGAAILLIHSDLDELLTIADRIAVFYNGRLTHTQWPDATKDQIGRLMLGTEPMNTNQKSKIEN